MEKRNRKGESEKKAERSVRTDPKVQKVVHEHHHHHHHHHHVHGADAKVFTGGRTKRK